ncbi:MAG: tripartite tricarboxylate transporter substrate binding protein, partial [Burkholderiales bacterium]|nr:tripartite tricarboxylate transporter substrate binding protein [Burkholderiales bacterium]
LPEVPTIAEAGVPDATGQSWNAMLARAGTPPEIARKVNADVAAALRSPEVVQRLATVGFSPIGSSADELAAVMRSDLAKWGKVIRDNNIKPQ